MKARFTNEQIIAMIKEQKPARRQLMYVRGTGSVLQRSTNTNRSTGDIKPSDAKRLRALEDENGPLKKLNAEHMLDNAMRRHQLKKAVPPVAKRKAVAHLVEAHQVSQRPLPDRVLRSNVPRGGVRCVAA